jgi:hypothetical protein
MKFNVTYWQPAQYAAVVDQDEVIAALQDYIDSEPQDKDAERAHTALEQVKAGTEPDDLDVVATALEQVFEVPEGTLPDRYDVATDYTAEVRPE